MKARHRFRAGPVGVAILAVVALALIVPATQGSASTPAVTTDGCSQTAPTAGCQGIVSALPSTSSQVTVSGHGQYSGVSVTVNQTANLTNQAVSVSWTGASPTFSDPTSKAFDSTFNGNYFQIFQCWGDPQSSDPSNAGPGPLPSQCEFGGESSSPSSSYPIKDIGFEYSRVLSENGWDSYSQLSKAPGTFLDTTDNFVIEPFDAVDGTVVNQQADYNYLSNPFKPLPFWLNPYFSFSTTNEVDFARTFSNGTGQQLFQVDTGLEAPGLGCGQSIQPVGGGTKTPQCWLVVVPRSTPAVENPANVTNASSVVTSPLTPEAWANRIAIPLKFNPVGSSCAINANAQQIIGGELASPAVASWQPALCNLPGATPFGYIQNSDDQARQNLTNPSYGSVGMSVFSNPIPPSQTKPSKPVVYAPLTLSGAVVAFNIERVPITEADGTLQPQELNLSGDRVQHLYLTPLLVARLLTESYRDQLQDVAADSSAHYAWAKTNPVSLFSDPTFLEYNPEFSQLSSVYQGDAGSLLVEEGSADATATLWKWVLSDPEAAAWLNAAPGQGADQGMNVNPYYSTNPSINPSGLAFGSPTPEIYPKSDPYCVNTGSTVYQTGSNGNRLPARPLCIQDWSPYLLNMRTTALDTAAANDAAKTTFDPTQTPDLAWTANGPQITGNYFVMSITDSASAARYGLQTASLSAAGDDSPDRTFVAPDSASILAGEQAMVPTKVHGVVETNPSSTGTGAYPLSMLTYAATTPETLNASSRKNYSAFLRYAAGAGQVTGDQPGQLPNGYVPLPASLEAQTLSAAATVLNPPATTTSKKLPNSTGHDKSGPGSGGSGTGSSGGSGGGSSSGGGGSGSGSGPGSKHRSPEPAGVIVPSELSAVRTEGFAIGLLRWALPFLLLIGVGAALGAVAMNLTRRRRMLAGAGEGDAVLEPEPGPPEGDAR